MRKDNKKQQLDSLVKGSTPTRVEMKDLILPFLHFGVDVPPINTQCLQNSAATKERSVLTLDSLCLPCYMRHKA